MQGTHPGRTCLRLLVGVATGSLFLVQAETSAAPARAPSIVLIVADDMGYGDLGCYGATDIRTPHIDRLAAQGVRFTNFYANGPECTPTRTALLTGRYQHRVGGLECAIGTGNVGRYDDAIRLAEKGELGLPPRYNALPSALKKVGYRAAAFGKWHVGYDPKFRPLGQGFDRAFGPLGGGVDYFHHTEPAGRFLGADLPGEHVLVRDDKPHRQKGYLTHLITAEAVAWVRKQPTAQPFFLYVPYTAPHTPYQGPGDFRPEKLTADAWNEGNRAKYAEMVGELDRGVGEIVAALEEKGLTRETLVIFFSDNGPTPLGSTGSLRGRKGQLFEGGIRTPCIVRWPGRIRPGTVTNQATIGMDLTASIVRAAGARGPEGRPFDGIDIVAHLEGRKPDRPRTLFWRARRGARTEKAVRDGALKYLHRQLEGGELEQYLFDLGADPKEQTNLLTKRPDQTSRLEKLLARWEEEVKPER